jgi:hypothetical protein
MPTLEVPSTPVTPDQPMPQEPVVPDTPDGPTAPEPVDPGTADPVGPEVTPPNEGGTGHHPE